MIFKPSFASMKPMSDEEIKETDAQNATEQVYELGYLLLPTILEENVSAAFGNLKELTTSLAGVPVSEEMPKMIQLAYPMSKVVANTRHRFTAAYFGWLKFTMGVDKVL